MTQPYPPYNYGPYGYPPPPDLSRPARRAGLMMIILGSLTLVLGICAGFAGQFVQNNPDLPADFQAKIHQMESQVHVSIGTMMIAVAVIIIVPGLLMMVLSIFVRKGGFVSAVLGIILTSLILLYLIVNILGSVAAAAATDPASVVTPACIGVALLALFGLQLFWLVKAAFNAGPLKAFNQYQQAWQWQSQQHYQQFQQPYGTPPPPPPTMPPSA